MTTSKLVIANALAAVLSLAMLAECLRAADKPAHAVRLISITPALNAERFAVTQTEEGFLFTQGSATKDHPHHCGIFWAWHQVLVNAGKTIGFEAESGFPRLPDTITLGACSAVAVDSQGEIYLAHRGKHPILCLNASGEFLRSCCGSTPMARSLARGVAEAPSLVNLTFHTCWPPTRKETCTSGRSKANDFKS